MYALEGFRVGPWVVKPAANRIRGPDGMVRLSPKAMDVLVALGARPGEVIPKDELLSAVWAQEFVTEDVLKHAVMELRKALGDSASDPRFIETIPKRGYRLMAPVSPALPAPIAGDAPAPRNKAAHSGAGRKRWRVLIAGLLVAASVGVAASRWEHEPPPASDEGPVRLVALDFDDLSPRRDQGYLAAGISDLLRTELASLSGLRVIAGTPRGGAVAAGAVPAGSQALARRLGAPFVLRGAVVAVEDRVRVTAQLIEAGDGGLLWAESYERDLGDVLNLQRELARHIARGTRLQLTQGEESRLARRDPVNPDALRNYLQGVDHYDRWEPGGLPRSLEYFEEAVRTDPRFALAHARRAHTLGALALGEYVTPEQALRQGLRAAEEAVRLDPGSAEVQAAVAAFKTVVEWDWRGAEEALERALELNPDSAFVRMTESLYRMARGESDENVAAMERALELEPLSHYMNLRMGWSLFMARRHEEAAEHLRRTLELFPESYMARSFLAENYALLGRGDDALALCEPHPRPCAWVYAHLGHRRELAAIPHADGSRSPLGNVRLSDLVLLARIHVAFGENEEAFRLLGQAIEERRPDAAFLLPDPRFDLLRGDPRWAELIAKVGPI